LIVADREENAKRAHVAPDKDAAAAAMTRDMMKVILFYYLSQYISPSISLFVQT
jgi:hypothetical protein